MPSASWMRWWSAGRALPHSEPVPRRVICRQMAEWAWEGAGGTRGVCRTREASRAAEVVTARKKAIDSVGALRCTCGGVSESATVSVTHPGGTAQARTAPPRLLGRGRTQLCRRRVRGSGQHVGLLRRRGKPCQPAPRQASQHARAAAPAGASLRGAREQLGMPEKLGDAAEAALPRRCRGRKRRARVRAPPSRARASCTCPLVRLKRSFPQRFPHQVVVVGRQQHARHGKELAHNAVQAEEPASLCGRLREQTAADDAVHGFEGCKAWEGEAGVPRGARRARAPPRGRVTRPRAGISGTPEKRAPLSGRLA